VLLLTQEQADGTQEETLKAAILELARPVCPVEILTTELCRGSAQVTLGEEGHEFVKR
jgi:hypothetical protein